MKITKDNNGMLHAQAYLGNDVNGKRVYKRFSAYSKKELEKQIADARADFTGEIKKESNVTLKEAIEQYIRSRDNILSPSTIKMYWLYSQNHLRGIANIRVKDLTLAQIQNELNIEAKSYSPKTVRNIWMLAQSAIRSVNPSVRYDVQLPPKVRKEMTIPTQQELYALIDEVHDTPLEIPVLLACTCGLRRSEIAALNYNEDVDYARNKISVNKAMVSDKDNVYQIKATKSYNSTRIIDCPSWVIDRIAEVKDSVKQLNPNEITQRYEHVARRLNLKARFHDLRHYFASVMLALGVPDKYAMKRMGHATPDMLKNVYQHIMADKDAEFSAVMSDFFGKMQQQMQQ